MSTDKPLPRKAALEDTGRIRGWASMVKEAEAELERWVERRRRVRQRERQPEPPMPAARPDSVSEARVAGD